MDYYLVQFCIAVLSKGQVITPYYRWLLKDGRCLWMQSVVTGVAEAPDCIENTYLWNNYLIG